MLKIRLQRVGRKHEPVFRVVLTDSKNSTKSGKYLEVLGSFDARSDERRTLDAERIKYWMSQGAEPSDTLHNFFVEKKIIQGKKKNVLPKKSLIKKEEKAAEAVKPVSAQSSGEAKEAPKAEEAPKA